MENRVEILKKLKIKLPYDPAITFLGYLCKGNKNKHISNRYLHTHVYIAALFIIAKKKVKATQLSISGCVDEQNVIHVYTQTYTQWNIEYDIS